MNINSTFLHTSNIFSSWNSATSANSNNLQLNTPSALSSSSTPSSTLNVQLHTYHRNDFKNRRSSSEPVQDQLAIQNSIITSQICTSKDIIRQNNI